MRNAIKIFTYKGVPVYLKYWFLILLLFIPYFKVFSLFIGVLVHELAHAIKAKNLGYKTDYIFIDVLYGGALVDSNYRFNNSDAIKIALAGPVSNLILAGVVFILSSTFYHFFGDIYSVLHYSSSFMLINLLLGLGNLVPVYPLDGGRVTKAILNIFYNRKKSRKINAVISIVTTIIVIILSIIYNNWFLALFSLLFIFIGYSEWRKQ